MYTVKQARQLAGLTQGQVAEQMGVNVDTYRKIEANPECATVERARRFCEIVGMSFDSIFFTRNSTESRNNSAGT